MTMEELEKNLENGRKKASLRQTLDIAMLYGLGSLMMLLEANAPEEAKDDIRSVRRIIDGEIKRASETYALRVKTILDAVEHAFDEMYDDDDDEEDTDD